MGKSPLLPTLKPFPLLLSLIPGLCPSPTPQLCPSLTPQLCPSPTPHSAHPRPHSSAHPNPCLGFLTGICCRAVTAGSSKPPNTRARS
uniref:Uncharacterized protein n=1 Tax=Taeniopygia guttata TaxID=59729 RepID=A0A674G7R7_TAEGU